MFDTAQAFVIDRYKNPLYAGQIIEPDIIAKGENPLCGDQIEMYLKVDNDTITAIKHQCHACAICTAATDLLAEALEGKSLKEIISFTPEALQELVNLPLSPTRLKCALLPLEALKQAQI